MFILVAFNRHGKLVRYSFLKEKNALMGMTRSDLQNPRVWYSGDNASHLVSFLPEVEEVKVLPSFKKEFYSLFQEV